MWISKITNKGISSIENADNLKARWKGKSIWQSLNKMQKNGKWK